MTRFRYYEKKGLLHCYFLLPGSNAGTTMAELSNAILYDCGFFAPTNTIELSKTESKAYTEVSKVETDQK